MSLAYHRTENIRKSRSRKLGRGTPQRLATTMQSAFPAFGQMSAMRKILALALLAWFALPLAGLAKRMPAPVVEPIVHQGVRYAVPNDKGTKGYVVASDADTGKQLWKKTIFRKWICPCLEHDVQWVFIKQMRLDAGRLVLVDERDRTYALDLRTRSVRRLKALTR